MNDYCVSFVCFLSLYDNQLLVKGFVGIFSPTNYMYKIRIYFQQISALVSFNVVKIHLFFK